MIKIPIHSNKKLLLAFEFGMAVSEIAKEQRVEMTPEIVKRAEDIILNESLTRNASQIAGAWQGLLLAVFEPKEKDASNNN